MSQCEDASVCSRSVLTAQEWSDLFEHLGEYLDLRPHPTKPGQMTWNCDNTLAATAAWACANGKPVEKVLSACREHGGYCDCEVMLNVHPHV